MTTLDLAEPESPRRKLNDELVQLARSLSEVGPNINLVARRTSRFKESVRYRYHKFFLEKGITVQAVPNYAKLGFKRLVLIAKLARGLDGNAKLIFNALAETCYLHSFTRVMLRGDYTIHVAVPAELRDQCAEIYRNLHEQGLFAELEVLEFDEFRNPPMKPEFYNFVRGSWNFDWSSAKCEASRPNMNSRPRVERYDKTDILILKELEIDAGRKLVKMSESSGLKVGTLEFHYRDHVEARGLVNGYRLVWQGTRYDHERQLAVSRKDLYIELTIILKGCAQGEMAELMALLNRTPFIWSEAYGAAYCAEIFLPNYAIFSFLEYLDEFANKVGDKMRILVMDQSRAVRFVISHPLFDGSAKKWRLSETDVLNSVGSLVPIVTKSAAGS